MDTNLVFTPQAGYTLPGGEIVMPATATGAAANTVPAGQYGGQGMAMPTGSTPIGGAGGGMAGANMLSGFFTDIGKAASNYVQAGAMKGYVPPVQVAQPLLAQMPLQALPYSRGG